MKRYFFYYYFNGLINSNLTYIRCIYSQHRYREGDWLLYVQCQILPVHEDEDIQTSDIIILRFKPTRLPDWAMLLIIRVVSK